MRFAINPFTDLLDIASISGSGAPQVETITGNSGGAVGPNPGTFNLNIVGDNTTGLNVVGNAGTFTLTIGGIASSNTQVGTTRYATNAEAAAQTIATAALTPANITSMFSTHSLPTAQGGTGLSSPAAHQLMVTEGASAFTLLGVASNGQIPIGSIGSDPVLAAITAGTGITVTNGPGTITIAANGSAVLETLTGNSGGAISPTAGNINTLGTGSITIVGSGSTLTTELTSLTNHNVLVGAGTATITNVAPSATSGVALISQGSTTDPAFGTVVVAGGGTGAVTLTGVLIGNGTSAVTGNAVTQHDVIVGGASNALTSVAPSATSGVPLISQGAASDPTFGTAVVAGGGTGVTSNTAYAVLTGGTTSTGAIQSIASVGTTGQVLTSNGAAALPTFQAASGNITGPGSSTNRAISTWNGTSGTALFDNSTTQIDSTGRMTNSAQPAVLAILNAAVSNVTGNATNYTVIFNTAIFNRGSNFNTSNGTFTAPVTGLYHVNAQVIFTNVGVAATQFQIYINATSRQCRGESDGPINNVATNVRCSSVGILLDMTATDTFTVSVLSNGQGADTIGLAGDAAKPLTYVSCYLVA